MFTFCSLPTLKVSLLLSQMLCKIQQAFITPGMFRWFIRQYHLPFSLPETWAADILQGIACSSSLKAQWQALQTRWAGFPACERRIVKEARKKASSLSKLVTADQPLFPTFLKSWALFSRPCHAEAQITHTCLVAAVPGKEHTNSCFLTWSPCLV